MKTRRGEKIEKSKSNGIKRNVRRRHSDDFILAEAVKLAQEMFRTDPEFKDLKTFWDDPERSGRKD